MAVNSITLNDTFEDWVNTTNDIGVNIGDLSNLVTPVKTNLVAAINSLDSGFDSDFGLKTTDNLSEGTTNLYYTSARADSDFIISMDSAAGKGLSFSALNKLNIDSAELYSQYKHDGFADFVANEHINHTSITLTAGKGLSGGGTIAASRSFAIDSAEFDAGFAANSTDIYDNHTSTKVLTVENVNNALDFVTLDSNGSAQFSIDSSGVLLGINFKITLNKDMSFINPVGEGDWVGRTGMIRVTQDVTGGHTLSWGDQWKFSYGTAISVSDSSSSEDLLAYAFLSEAEVLVTSAAEEFS